jgi:hypothetical protein
MTHNTYKKSDGTIGVGFFIERSGRKMHSIAWPNEIAERMMPDELERKGVICDWPTTDDNSVDDEGNPIAIDFEERIENRKENDPEFKEALEKEDADEEESSGKPKSEAQHIRDYLSEHPDAGNAEVIDALDKQGVQVIASQVGRQRSNLKKD